MSDAGTRGPVAIRRLGAALGHLVAWAPVWVSLLLLWQVGTRGLKPALAEERRLDQEEEVVRARNARTQAEFEHLAREAEAWQDPVYRERMRRAMNAEDGRVPTTSGQ